MRMGTFCGGLFGNCMEMIGDRPPVFRQFLWDGRKSAIHIFQKRKREKNHDTGYCAASSG